MKNIGFRLFVSVFLIFSGLSVQQVAAATQIDIPGPTGSGRFGEQVIALPNGNIIITDPSFDTLEAANVGAVYLYNGATGALISRLRGSNANDRIGFVVTLPNGKFVALSNGWKNGAGAVTLCSGTTGCDGEVSDTNSLVGSTTGDGIGGGGIGFAILANGNYVVKATNWDNGSIVDAGSVTLCSGTTGCTGVVSAANSLVGSQTGDTIGGNQGILTLANGNYVVQSRSWDNGTIVNAGASTFCSGTTGCTGPVSTANSLVGTMEDEGVGSVVGLTNGNYVASNPRWKNGTVVNAGAVRLCSGTTGCTGIFSPANSLIGSTTNDQVGQEGYSAVRALSNGNFVVVNPVWDNGAIVDAGAVTFCSGTTGCIGPVSAANSLINSGGAVALPNGNYLVRSRLDNAPSVAGAVTFCNGTTGCTGLPSAANSLIGSQTEDRVGTIITALPNSDYIVQSRYWNNGAINDAGAVTFCNGTTGCTGMVVSAANSLVGSSANDQVGSDTATVLTNGNYVVSTRTWDNGEKVDVGAVTFCSGTTGCTGVVSAANSLIGLTENDNVGQVTALANGNYVVSTQLWNNGATVDVGAVTLCSGTGGCTGVVSAANSLIGSQPSDRVSNHGAVALTNGNYVVNSEFWDNGSITDVGAVTWCSGTTGCTGAVSAANSLVGSTAGDKVGSIPGAEFWLPNIGGIGGLSSGDYFVRSSFWDNGTIVNAGALTFGDGNGGTVGPITADNSVFRYSFRITFDAVNNQLVIGRPLENIVTLFRRTLGASCIPALTITEEITTQGDNLFVVTAGVNSVTINPARSQSGLQTLTLVSATNAVVNVPTVTPDTTNPVTVTFTITNPTQAVDITLRATGAYEAIRIRLQCGASSGQAREGDLLSGGMTRLGARSGRNFEVVDAIKAESQLTSFRAVTD